MPDTTLIITISDHATPSVRQRKLKEFQNQNGVTLIRRLLGRKRRHKMPITPDAVKNTMQTIELKARDVEETHKRTLNKKLKARSDVFWTFTRSTEMVKLYSDCLKEEPPYVPKKFREENAVCNKLSEHKLSAEIEILQLRARENEKKLEKIDGETSEFFQSKVQEEDVLKELKSTWEKKAKEDETGIIKRWEKRIKEEKDIFHKDKTNNGQSPKPNQNQEQASTRANNDNSENNRPSGRPANKPTQWNPTTQYKSTRPRTQNFVSPQIQATGFRTPSAPNIHPASKNFHSSHLPQPPRPLPLSSSTFHLSPWPNDTLCY